MPFEKEHQLFLKDIMSGEAASNWVLRAKSGWEDSYFDGLEWPEGPVYFVLNIDTQVGWKIYISERRVSKMYSFLFKYFCLRSKASKMSPPVIKVLIVQGNLVLKKISTVVLLLVGLLFAFSFWQLYYYGYRLQSMCDETEGRTVIELKTLIEDYGFNHRVVEHKDKDLPQVWYVGVRPSLVAACSITHDRVKVLSADFFWD